MIIPYLGVPTPAPSQVGIKEYPLTRFLIKILALPKATQKKKNNVGVIILPEFILYFKATLTKMTWYYEKQQQTTITTKTRHTDQCNRLRVQK